MASCVPSLEHTELNEAMSLLQSLFGQRFEAAAAQTIQKHSLALVCNTSRQLSISETCSVHHSCLAWFQERQTGMKPEDPRCAKAFSFSASFEVQ